MCGSAAKGRPKVRTCGICWIWAPAARAALRVVSAHAGACTHDTLQRAVRLRMRDQLACGGQGGLTNTRCEQRRQFEQVEARACSVTIVVRCAVRLALSQHDTHMHIRVTARLHLTVRLRRPL